MAEAVAAAAVWVANTVGSAVGATLTAAGVTASTALPIAATVANAAYFASQIAIYAGMQYAVDSATRPKTKPIGSELTFNMDPAYPREMVVGEQLIGGSLVARYSKGSNRKEAHFVIQVADHPCVALNAVYGDNRLVRDSALSHGVRTEITAYSNSGGPRVWMTWHDGRPGQTADSNLVSASAADPEVVAGRLPGWTSDHKGAGCAYVHIEVWYDSDILTAIPSWLFQVKGAEFYDRRKDSTAGGSGSHRLDDPSTWEYTTNAAVVWDHWSLGYKVEDDDLAFGLGLSKTELPYAQFANQADLCDEDVETGTGGSVETIKRYVINGVLTTATFFEDQLEDFQFQMAGRIVDLGGRIGFLGSEEKAITVSLTDRDLISGEALQYADKLGFDELYGRVTGNFRDPANLYQATPYQEQVTAYAALPDGGEAQAVTLDFPLEIHPRRAARNASAWLSRESLQPRLVATFRPKAWKLEPGDWFDYSDAGLQVDESTFEVIDIAKNADFTVTLTARAIDPNFLAFDNDNDPDLSVPPDVPPVDFALDDPEGTIEAIALAGSGVSEPALRFTLTDIDDMAREVVLEVRKWNGSSVTGDAIIVTAHADEPVTLVRAGILPSQAYVVRIKARAGRRESDWTAYSSPVTTGSTYTVPGSSLASAIVGQGWGATASQADADNAYVPLGENLIINTDWARDIAGWYLSGTTDSGLTLVAGFSDADGLGAYSGAIRTRYHRLIGTQGAGTYADGLVTKTYGNLADLKRWAVRVNGGERIHASMYMSAHRGRAQLIMVEFDDAGSAVGSGSGWYGTANHNSFNGGNPANAERVGGFVTLNSATRYVVLIARLIGNGGLNPYLFYGWPMVAKVSATQTVAPPYKSGQVDRYSDHTPDNTAAAIINQNWGATASEAAARATRGRGLAKNSLFQEYFTGTAIPPQWIDWSNGSGTYSDRAFGDGKCYQVSGGAGASAGIQHYCYGIQASTPYLLVGEVKRESGSLAGAGVLVEYYNSGLSLIGSDTIVFATAPTTAGLTNSSPDGVQRWEKLVTMPAGTTLAVVYAMTHYAGLGSISSANGLSWYECDLIPMALVRELRADVTSGNTAAAFVGQGLMSLLNSAAYGSGYLTGFGALAALANALGLTAGAITDQGNFATVNFSRGAGDPSGTEGQWRVNTTTNQLKLYTGGAWQVIADISGTAYTVSHNGPAVGHRTGAGSVSSAGVVTLTPANGTGPYAYRWGITDNPHSFNLNAVDGVGQNTYSIDGTISAGVTWRATVYCDVTDQGTGLTIRVTIYDNVLYDDT